MLKIILIVEAIGKPDKRRHHRFVSFASVRLNGIVCFVKGKMHCFATLDKAELRRSIKRRQTASVFPVVVERHNTTLSVKTIWFFVNNQAEKPIVRFCVPGQIAGDSISSAIIVVRSVSRMEL